MSDDEIILQIRDFCDTGYRRDKFLELPEGIQHDFNEIATFVIEHDSVIKAEPNKKAVRKVINYYITRELNQDQLRGLRASLLAAKLYENQLKMLGTIPPNKMVGHVTRAVNAPYMEINFVGGDSIQLIPAGEDLRGQIMLVDANRQGVSEYIYHPPDLKEALIFLILKYKYTVESIYNQVPDQIPKTMYLRRYGVVWDMDECVACLSVAKQYDLIKGWDITRERKAWHKIALKLHPDKGGDDDKMAILNDCREKLLEDDCIDEIRYKSEDPFQRVRVAFFDLDETLICQCGKLETKKTSLLPVYQDEENSSTTYSTAAIMVLLAVLTQDENCLWYLVSRGHNRVKFQALQSFSETNGIGAITPNTVSGISQYGNEDKGITISKIMEYVKRTHIVEGAVFVDDSAKYKDQVRAALGDEVEILDFKPFMGPICPIGDVDFPLTFLYDTEVARLARMLRLK